jgi:hypothetical protein
MKKKWFAAALAGTLLAVLLLNGCASAQMAKRLRFGVAGEGGIPRLWRIVCRTGKRDG